MLPISFVVRLAVRLQAVWQGLARPPLESMGDWDRMQAQLVAVARVRRRVQLATSHRLSSILPELTADLGTSLEELARRVETLAAGNAPSRFTVPELGAWVADLRQIEEEFGSLTIDWKRCTLRVATDSIRLGDVDLGPFEILFDWSRVGRSPGAGCFVLTALTPHPAAGKADVHHPHVQDHTLCAGDASDSLDAAVAAGRLADAFLLVRSVLTTHNPHSAYAPLDAWDGTTCSDCGQVVVQDDRFTCEGCESDLCDPCSTSCTVCSATRCFSCLQRCSVCEDYGCPGCLVETASGRWVCPTCRTTCGHCDSIVATDEVDDSTGLCPNCHADASDREEDPVESPIPTEVPEPCVAMTPPRDD